MKKPGALLLAVLFTVCSFSQAPEKMSYQAVIRNGSGELVKSSQVNLKISILQYTADGTVVFSETHSTTTNANGLATLEIGSGVVVSGSISSIDWADGPYFLKTETDVTGGTNYALSGTSQLLTVPYALYAKTAENFVEKDGSVTNELQTLRISNDTIYLSDGGFVKLPAANTLLLPPSATAQGVSDIENYSAVLNGVVNANNLLTAVEFEWGTTTSYGSMVIADQSPLAGSTNIHVTAILNALQTDENYHYRIKASNVVNTTYSDDFPFTIDTLNLVLPTVTTSAITDIAGISAKSGGNLVNNGGAYITAQGLCWSLDPSPEITNNITNSFTDLMNGLSTNTVYHVRAFATNAAGTAYGNEVTFNSGYELGKDTLGGLVFYNDGNEHGLVCDSIDQNPRLSWGCYGTLIATTSTVLGTGTANTTAITAGCSTVNIAAKVCNDLVLDIYDDWYLPSKEELALLYKNLRLKGLGKFANEQYWTSSEVNSATVWYENFTNGLQNYDGKEIPFKVRAVRSF